MSMLNFVTFSVNGAEDLSAVYVFQVQILIEKI